MDSETKICLGAKMKINPERILMLKSDANYTYVYLDDGSYFLSSITLGILAKRLDGFQFIRPNRSVLVNLHYIANVNYKTYIGHSPYIQLANKAIIPIARRKATILQSELNQEYKNLSY